MSSAGRAARRSRPRGGTSTTSGPPTTAGSRSAAAAACSPTAPAWAAGSSSTSARRPSFATEIARFFPGLRGRRIDAAWGGPVDVSPIHLPCVGSLAGIAIHYVCGFTGNGVGPAHLGGRILADLALDRRTELTRLALVEPEQPPVPPEPLRWLGGNAVRAALLRQEGREDRGLSGGVLGELVIEVPRRLGHPPGR